MHRLLTFHYVTVCAFCDHCYDATLLIWVEFAHSYLKIIGV